MSGSESPLSAAGVVPARRRAGLRARWRRRARGVPQDIWNLRFELLGTYIPAGRVAESPTLLVIAAEEVCWRIARDTLAAARPALWRRRARAQWRAQRRGLEQKRQRLRVLAEKTLADGS
ncbi:MAG TPA: hypothetical protein VGM10_11485 [Actinocrinis sp.]